MSSYDDKLEKPKIGMKGISLQAITQGKRGDVALPVGARDSTRDGGRVWEKIKLTAFESVRENQEIVVCNEQGEIKESAGLELSFRQVSGYYEEIGEETPMPVTNCSKAINHYNQMLTAQGFTELIKPSEGKKIRVHWYSISNAHGADVRVGMNWDGVDTTTLKHRYYLAAQGGAVAPNILDAAWEGKKDEILYGYLSVACADGVYFNIGYVEVDV